MFHLSDAYFNSVRKVTSIEKKSLFLDENYLGGKSLKD